MKSVPIGETTMLEIWNGERILRLVTRVEGNLTHMDYSPMEAKKVLAVSRHTKGETPYGKPGDLIWVQTDDDITEENSRFTLVIEDVEIRQGVRANGFVFTPETEIKDDIWYWRTLCSVHDVNVQMYRSRQDIIDGLAKEIGVGPVIDESRQTAGPPPPPVSIKRDFWRRWWKR